MMQGIFFDETHNWDDLHLVLSQVKIPPSMPKTTFVDIPGGDGSVDLTEALGETRYKTRDASFVFSVLPTDDFEQKKTELSNLINGRKCKIILDKDPGYFWIGRCQVSAYSEAKKIRKITVKATLEPYKYKTKLTTVMMPISTNGVDMELKNSRKTVVPTITCAAAATIVFRGNTYKLGAGTHKILDLALKEGTNALRLTSTKAVTFTYQEGDL
jgi:phage-related protein